MTINSDHDKVERKLTSALDDDINRLPEHVVQDIKRARLNALARGRQEKKQTRRQLFSTISFRQTLMSGAVAVLLVILVNYLEVYPSDTSVELTMVPVIPKVAFDQSVPTEDLTLLQDLEFASWLVLQDADEDGAVL